MKRLLNVDDGWLAGIQNCPPQGNLGGGVDEVLDLEAVARRWLGEPSVLTKEQHEGRVVIEAREEHPVNGAGGSTLRRWREGGWGTCAGPVWNWCQYGQQVPHR